MIKQIKGSKYSVLKRLIVTIVKNRSKSSKYSISKQLIVTFIKNRSNNLKFGQQKLKSIQPRYDDGNRSYRSPWTRRNENLCIPRPCKTATTTTSCIDHYRTKTKWKFTNFRLLGTLNDTTNIEDHNKLRNKGSKGLTNTTQLYTAKWDIHN